MLSTVPSTAQQPDVTPLEASGLQGYVHSTESAGTVDGPGVRYIVFVSGCPLSCQYCHNPDTRKLKSGNLVTTASILDEIKSCAPFLKRAHGGVTVSGGEPLAQPDFTRAVFEGSKEMGLHTTLDTSGFLGGKADDALLDATDLVLLDIKSGLPEIYEEVTAVQLAPTLAFAERLSGMGKPVWVRFVLVPGLTDGEKNIEAVARIASDIKSLARVDILPFHKMGEYKWEHLRQKYKLADTPEATDDDVARAAEIFARCGIEAL